MTERTALVTGGTVRLGLAIADCLRRGGWRVATTSHRPGAGADITADLASDNAADRLFASAVDFFGGRPPFALVNNAALFSGGDAELERVNFLAPSRLAKLMAERGGGCVVNVLDSRILRRPAETPYERTKARLLDATLDAARRHLGRLRVNAVAPGPALAPVSVREKAGETPFGRPTPEAIADAVAFLLDASFTSGVVLPVDGAQSLIR